MRFKLLCLLCISACGLFAGDQVAEELARRADRARNTGQIVRAYLLYAEAATRDPNIARYRTNRDALAPAAKLLAKTEVQDSNISADLEEAERSGHEPPVETASRGDWEREQQPLQPLPRLKPADKLVAFDLRGDERILYQQVLSTFGVEPVFDPQLEARPPVHFAIAHADFRTALEGLAAATGTFVFPISEKQVFVARNSEQKRIQYEPNILLTFPLPEAADQKDLIDAMNAVRSVLTVRSVGWDSVNRVVMIRDRASRARLTYDLLQTLLLPRSEVSLQVQLLTVDSDRMYHYGLALPTSFPLAYLGQPGGFKSLLPSFANPVTMLSFGGGTSIFGIGLANSTLFAAFSRSESHNLFDARIRVSGGQTATFHVGDQYPIAQSIYTGFSQGSGSIYNPAPQISMVDLGIVLKIVPRVQDGGNIALDVEAEYKALGNQTFNTVPSVLDRRFKGAVTVQEGESAIIAGLDADTESATRNGLLGLSQVPGLNQVLSENTLDLQKSRTLVVIKPTVLRQPVSLARSPQFLIGPQRGQLVIF